MTEVAQQQMNQNENSQMDGVCKFCGNTRKLIRAHIIPESLFPLRDDKQVAYLTVTNFGQRRTKKSPKGWYDTDIVCGECETRWDTWDHHAANILRNTPNVANGIHHDGKLVAVKLPGADYRHLKLFFLSLLWRMSCSSRPEFSKINLPELEDDLRSRIIAEDPGHPDEYSVSLAMFDDADMLGLISPYFESHGNVRFVRMLLGNFCALVKTQNLPTPHPWAELCIRPDQVLAPIREARDSPEFRALVKMIKEAG